MKTIIQIILASLLSTFTSMAFAVNIAGQVIMVKGQAEATGNDGKPRPLKRRALVYENDLITTGNKSRIQIRFIDKGLLALRANSSLNIKSYRQPDNTGKGQVLMELIEGGFRTLTGSIGKTSKAAYKVETPVASIGIRGTLYSVLMQNDQLLAGVWNGGIRLDNDQGTFNLGAGADFNFASAGAGGITGLMHAPDELQTEIQSSTGKAASARKRSNQSDTGETVAESFEGNEEHTDNNHSITQDNNARAERQDDDVPSSSDRNESSLKQQLQQQKQPDQPRPGETPVEQSIDARLSKTEYQRFINGSDFGAYVVDGKIVPSAVVKDDDGNEMFVSFIDEDNKSSGIKVTRFDGQRLNKEKPMDHVEWGIWNASSDQPVEIYKDNSSLNKDTINQTALWMAVSPIRPMDLKGITGTVSFSGNEAIGIDNLGNKLTSASGSFDLNLSTGALSNGKLNASYGADTWQANFTGTIRPGNFSENTPRVNIDITSGNHNSSPINAESSDMKGVLTAPPANTDVPGFAGSFHLKEGNNSASGIVAWPGKKQ